jgi:DNA-directed RNA polymerase omega subunit
MLYPTIEELTQGKYNRYELALATAKCARLITDEYVRQHEIAEKSLTGNKETDRSITSMIDRELRDEKAVKVAINRIHRGEFCICENAEEIEAEDENALEVDGVEYVLVDDED